MGRRSVEHDPALLSIVESNATLCLNADDPGWDDARGYAFDRESLTLFFPVAKKYMDGRDLSTYSVLIWSQPRVLVTGLLSRAEPTDTARHRELLLASGMAEDQVNYMLYDQRSGKPRRNGHKLAIAFLGWSDR